MKTVLSTKKISDKQKAKLEHVGFFVVEKNFIQIEKINFSLENIQENLIFTSKNAVKSVLKHKDEFRDKKVFCVGEKTKKMLQKEGFTVVETENYAEDLAQKIIHNFPSEKFTFFCGNLRRETLPNILKENSVVFNEIEVYKTALHPHKIEGKTDVILFYSPSGVNSFLTENSIQNETCICIGKTTAKALENKTKNILIAAKPSLKSVIKTCIKINT